MIKQLKHRVVAISMVLVLVVLLLFFFTLFGAFSLFLRQEVKEVLEDSAEVGAFNFVPSIGAGEMEGYGLYYGNICVAQYSLIDNSVRIMEGSTAFLDDDLLVRAVSAAVADNLPFDDSPELGLFYYREDTVFGYNIAFTSSAMYDSYVRQMLVVGGVGYAIAAAVLYLITLLMANISLKPVEKVWRQQQNFIGDASHELKTPLTVILTNSNILMAHQDDTIRQQRKWLESTNEEAVHMKDLVDKLLILAKTDNMQRNKLFASVDLSDLTLRLALQFEPVAYEKGVAIHSEVEPGIAIVGDQTALNQIIHILLDNAVKYAGVGGEVTVSLKRRQNSVYLVTRNTGTPIPPEDLPHIFERFYRSDKARTAGGGYGLGLAICKNLAELHRAEITAASDETNGTVFTVRFRAGKK